MARKPQSFIPPQGPNTEAPNKAVTITLTPEQAQGIAERQAEIQAVTAAATQRLTDYLSGALAGRGYSGGAIGGYDAATRVLTFTPPPTPRRE